MPQLHWDESLIFGASLAFTRVIDEIDQYSLSPWPILLLGETGVGKELLARRIHSLSLRKRHPFLPLNCAALPPTLFENELFGYERGAFSGASQSNLGILRAANGGTLFFDEIGDLELSSQVKLLRFLDSGELRRVGSARIEQADIRLIAATNLDLPLLVRRRAFRLDLLERLSVLTVRIPPLRERKEDIPLLANALVEKLKCQLAPSVITVLQAYDWPGNIRQLKNVLIRAGVLGKNRISEPLVRRLLHHERDFAVQPQDEDSDEVWDGPLVKIEKRAVLERLRRNFGNRKRTAEDLGIAKSTLHEKLKRWKLDGHDADKNSEQARSALYNLDPDGGY